MGGGVISPTRLALAGGQEEVAPRLVVRSTPRPEELEGHPVEPSRLLERQQTRSPIAGATGVVDRRVRIPSLRGTDEVVSELREVWFGVVPVEPLEDLARLPMKLDPLRRTELLVQGVADQDVSEPPPAEHAGELGEHVARDRLVDQAEQVVSGDLRQAPQGLQLELATEHRCERQDPDALVRQPAEALTDHVADALGDYHRVTLR